MLKQVLEQISSKPQAKSNQRQRQIVAPRVLVLGMQVETPIHSSSYVTRASAATVERTNPDAWMVEDFDLDADVPCGHSQHELKHADEPAAFIVRALDLCGCDLSLVYPLCRFGWAWFGTGDVVCRLCGSSWSRDECLRIVQVLR